MIDSWRYKAGNYMANSEDIKQHIKLYVDLIEKCDTQPERMANQIHNLTKELESNKANYDTMIKKGLDLYEGQKRLVEMYDKQHNDDRRLYRHLDIKYDELLKENLEQHGKIKELNIALEDLQRSVFSRIKDRFKEWFFGKK